MSRFQGCCHILQSCQVNVILFALLAVLRIHATLRIPPILTYYPHIHDEDNVLCARSHCLNIVFSSHCGSRCSRRPVFNHLLTYVYAAADLPPLLVLRFLP
jgi:hypothetical protein